MGEVTAISWTDHTFNPWWGCTRVSPGCDHCYAEAFDKRVGGSHWGKGEPRRVFGEKHWNEPLRWNKAAEKAGKPAMVFCASMADVMDDEAPEGQRDRLWDLIDATPHLIWQLLTKRPQRYHRYLPEQFRHKNVWLGTTCENQEMYDLRWPILSIAGKGELLWISYEPAIGPVRIREHREKPEWIIFGGESGNRRRDCQRSWADVMLRDCRDLEIPFFVKQMSARTPAEGKALIPPDLMIQEFPEWAGPGEGS